MEERRREQIPEDAEKKLDPDWSADGTRIVFGNGPADTDSSIRVLDVNTHQVSTLPGSKGLYSPRWSPDGRYIVAMTFDSRSLMLFDFANSKVGGDREDQPRIPQLVEKRRICVLSCMRRISRP